ncbi:MAG: hypothetical protein KJ629_09615, partial [Candidatus Omnitrophica bacterium]|nr:hypothetical protein [Candidatus Omnitrophota bacterium]
TRDKKAKNDYRFHLFMAYFFLFIVGMLNYIHVLFVLVTIGLFYVFKIHRVEFKYLILLFSAPFLLFILHQIRVVSLLGINVWMTDMVLNTKKALGQIGYRELLDYYAKHGIVVWAVDFQSISVERVIEFFLNGLRYREGIIGVFVLLVLIVTAIFHIFNKNWKRKFDIDKLGLKILTLFIASISWTLIFPVHAANYFGATPYIMLAGMINLGWALIFATIIRQSFFDKSKIHIFIIVLFFVIFSCQRVGAFLKHPIASIPGSEVLQRYEKAKFYSNIWPLFVSYYTHEWTVGGLHPEDAVRRKPLAARYFLQKDKLYNDEYFRPDYYLYVYWQKVAPFGEPKHKKILDQTFPLVESGDKWFIYKM